MADAAGRPDRPRHDGPPPRPRAAQPRRRRPRRRRRPAAATRTASPASLPLLDGVEELIAARASTTAMVAVADRATTRRSALALAEAGVHALIEKPLAPDGDGRRAASPTPSSTRGLVGAVGHIERYNPALQQLRAAARGRRARRDLPDRHPPAGPVPGPDRRRRRRQGPGHARHRPHRLGHPAAVPIGVGARTAYKSGRAARGPGRRRRAARRRHGHQPPGELAVAVQGAGHDRHRRAGRVRRRHPHAPTSPSTRTARSRPTGTRSRRFRGVSEGDMTRFAFPQAGAAARRARGVPRRGAGQGRRHRHHASRPRRRSRSPNAAVGVGRGSGRSSTISRHPAAAT